MSLLAYLVRLEVGQSLHLHPFFVYVSSQGLGESSHVLGLT